MKILKIGIGACICILLIIKELSNYVWSKAKKKLNAISHKILCCKKHKITGTMSSEISKVWKLRENAEGE